MTDQLAEALARAEDPEGLALTPAELVRLSEELRCLPAIRRAEARYRSFSVEPIRDHLARHPDEPLQDVETWFGVNIGRLSEALRGRRT